MAEMVRRLERTAGADGIDLVERAAQLAERYELPRADIDPLGGQPGAPLGFRPRSTAASGMSKLVAEPGAGCSTT